MQTHLIVNYVTAIYWCKNFFNNKKNTPLYSHGVFQCFSWFSQQRVIYRITGLIVLSLTMIQWLFSVRYEFKHSLHVNTALIHFARERSETVKFADIRARKREYGNDGHRAQTSKIISGWKAISKILLLLISA
jgi:hypothetical protein